MAVNGQVHNHFTEHEKELDIHTYNIARLRRTIGEVVIPNNKSELEELYKVRDKEVTALEATNFLIQCKEAEYNNVVDIDNFLRAKDVLVGKAQSINKEHMVACNNLAEMEEAERPWANPNMKAGNFLADLANKHGGPNRNPLTAIYHAPLKILVQFVTKAKNYGIAANPNLKV